MSAAPAASVASAPTAGDTSVSTASQRTRLSRIAKTIVATSASSEPDAADVLRPVALA